MECLSFLVGPVVNLFKNLWTDFITEKLSNFTSSAKRVEEMEKKMKDLETKRDEIEEHRYYNNTNNLKIPTRVPEWLEDVKKIKKDFDNIPSNNDCFNFKEKYEAGEDALKLTKKIDDLITQSKEITWTNAKRPLGRVDSSKRPPSTSASGGDTQNGFKSRNKIFNDALKFLQHDDGKTQVIALCGMGGVGKTTLMKQLKEAAEDNNMFKWIVVVVVGKSSNLFKIQEVIAAHTGESLTETDEKLRATLLSKRFQEFSERNEKSLIILDDVWEKIKLEDIGLASPLPKGVKLLLTSREESICHQIAVDAKSALKSVKVDVLEEEEARDFFCQIAEISAKDDRDLYEIGCKIVKKCGCLPLAIQIIAADVKCAEKRSSVWKLKLKCLNKNNEVLDIVDMSYKNLEREDKDIFLLCGLFTEDSNIPIENLTRYAWGLKLLEQGSTMEDARASTETSVINLKNKYLLMEGDSHHCECVKMHDLVLAFVVGTISKGGDEGCWIIHHEDDFSKLSEANNMSQSCKQLSLTCKGMYEFPSEFQLPNLSLLKLMHGGESLRPQDFYATMKKLQVIALERMKYAFVPTSFQCSTYLRTLCLDGCSLMFDLTCIGNLSNLEVLSFANSGVTILPSTFGNLKKLRLLDVTGCYNLVIDDGVLKNLVKLEELYMIPYKRACCFFTDSNGSELAERSKNLSALEFEFTSDNAHLKNNMSFKKLKRFKLSVGCYFDKLETNLFDSQSYQNSLYLVTNRDELLKSKIPELFKNTDSLHLQVNDMNTLEDVDVKSPHPAPGSYSFYNLRVLVVSECAELAYLFTPSVASNLSKLEYLEISRCPMMEAVIHTENNGSDTIMFSNLKYLRLAKLPKLLSFSNSATSYVSSDISHMQPIFNKEDMTPKLEKLVLVDMENLKEIWPRQFSISNMCQLRELMVEGCDSIEILFNMDFGEIEQHRSSLKSITVERCDSLVKLFSCNPFPFLNNLQELTVKRCGSIQVLFNTELGRDDKSEEQVCSSSLRSIKVWECDSLVNLLPSNPMPLFNHLEELEVFDCASVEVIFDIDMGCVGEMDKVSSSRLRSIELWKLGKLREVWRIKDAGNNLIHGFEAVESICIEFCERFENLITPATTNFDMRALKQVRIERCGIESERKNELVESKQDQEIDVVSIPGKDSNDDISEIAFPSYLLPTFHNLHKLYLREYEGVEVVFEITTPSSRESPHNTQQPPILSYLEELELKFMERMSHVWKCDWNEFLILQKPQSQSSFNNLTTITMEDCHSIKYLFSPLMAKLLSNLKEVHIEDCDAIEEVVSNRDDEDASIYSHTTSTFFPHLDILKLTRLRNFKCIGGGANGISTHIHDQHKLSSWSLCQYAREISIRWCHALSSVVSWYAVGQMQKLQVLRIEDCESMTEVFETQEINKSDTDTGKSLPRLEYITMLKLPKLKILKIQGCKLLKHVFTFSTLESLAQLEELEIKDCKEMAVIVTEENGEQTTASDVVVFPHLKSLILFDLPNFVGFFLGTNEFIWPALEKVVISECPQITVFTNGRSTARKLNFINTSLGKHSVECGLNFQAQLPSYESTSSYRPTTMERLPWSYHNLIEVDMYNYNTSGGHTLFPSDKFLQQKLETVHCSECRDIEQIFDSQTDAEIPNLRQVDFYQLTSLKYIWKSKQGTVLKFPNLTRLSINDCYSLEYLFTCPMVGSLLQLQELNISGCYSLKVIVKGEEEEEEECDAIVNAIVEFPCLKSLKLEYLLNLEGFCLGKEAFEFPSLDTLEMRYCQEIAVFTKGDLSAPKLYAISKWGGRKYNIHNRLNSIIKDFTEELYPY